MDGYELIVMKRELSQSFAHGRCKIPRYVKQRVREAKDVMMRDHVEEEKWRPARKLGAREAYVHDSSSPTGLPISYLAYFRNRFVPSLPVLVCLPPPRELSKMGSFLARDSLLLPIAT